MDCRICGSNDLKLLYVQGYKNQFHFYECQPCGLVNLDLSQLNITENQEKYADVMVPSENPKRRMKALMSYEFIERNVPVKGQFLDIGCGNGSLLQLMKREGWEVTGLELLGQYAQYVAAKLDIKVHNDDFLTFESDGKYDLVSLRHVLEHIPDSPKALSKIGELLNSGGYAHLEFPNIHSLSHKWQRTLSNWGISRKKYRPEYQPGHCNEFSKRSFQRLLDLTGFELIRWETYSYKALPNFFYNHIPIGTKVRTIIRKVK